MIRGKAKDTSVMHDPVVSLRHEKDAGQKNRSQPRWAGCQSLNDNTLSSSVHELDRAARSSQWSHGQSPDAQNDRRGAARMKGAAIGSAGGFMAPPKQVKANLIDSHPPTE